MLHTKVKKDKIENENPLAHRLYDNKKEVYDYRLFISDFDSLSHDLDEIYNRLYQSTNDDLLELNICSEGGYFNDYLRLSHLCKEHFYKRVTSKLHFGYSAGALAFLLGDERICYPDSQLMLHNVSTAFSGKFANVQEQLNFDKEYFEKFMSEALSPYFTKKEIDDIWKGSDMYVNTVEMCKRKICTQVYAFSEYMDADLYYEFMTDKKSHKELIKIMYEGIEKFNTADADLIKYEYNKLFRTRATK